MPISNETIIEANRKMLGKTNRAVLFAKVNLDEYLDPDVAEDDREYTPSLARCWRASRSLPRSSSCRKCGRI